MLIHADVKSLEVCCAAYLSKDPTLCQEIWNNYTNPTQDDLHTTNQKVFQLPDRVTAKRFTFKMLYGGSDYGFSIDPKFNHVSSSKSFWANVIERFYSKYQGVRAWHNTLLPEVLATGQLVAPTGRCFTFDRADVAKRDWFWLPKLKNYPVQGLGADLVAIGRVAAWKRLRKAGIPVLFQSTVHDSLDIDCEACYNRRVIEIVKGAIEDIPLNFERLLNKPFDLPLTTSITSGPNLKEQHE